MDPVVVDSYGLVDLREDAIVPVVLRYEPVADPLAVYVEFVGANNGRTVHWALARELLAHGLAYPAGEGDVQVEPHARFGLNLIVLGLRPPGTTRRVPIGIPRQDVQGFLARTLRACPAGSEAPMVDAALDDFLATF